MFIAFDGIDGSGKTSACLFTKNYLENNNKKVMLYNMGELGYLDKELKLLKHKKINCTSEIRELLYYFEGNLFSNNILEKVTDKDHFCIIDRYLLSFLSYGPLNGVEYKRIDQLTSNMLLPNLYFYLDVSPETSYKRISKERNISVPEVGYKNNICTDDLELQRKQFISFQSKVRENFNYAINNNKSRMNIKIINGESSVKEREEKIINCLRNYI